MAYAVTPITLLSPHPQTDDKNLIVVNAADNPISVDWEDDTLASLNNPAYPPELVVGQSPLIFSQGTATKSTSWIQVMFNFFGRGISFNTLGLIYHNSGDIGTIDAEAWIWDPGLVNPLMIASQTFTDNQRKMAHLTNQYNNVEFLAFRFTNPSGFAVGDSFRLGLAIAGNRYQLARRPDEPVSLNAAQSYAKEHRSDLGGFERYPQGKGLRDLRLTWRPSTQDGGQYPGTWNDAAMLDSVYVATEGWTKPFAWCPSPNVSPKEFFWMQNKDMKHDIKHVSGNTLKSASYGFREMAPSFDSEVHGWT